jgi:ribonucleoside-diphosphate reductase alpha chain
MTATSSKQTLDIKRRHTKEGQHPRQTCEWEKRDISIKDLSTGKPVFEQFNVEVPKHWSENACNIVVQKYFNGKIGTNERESSIHDLITRVTSTFSKKAVEHGYVSKKDQEAYEHELYYIVLHQHATWNSPVWFNLGIEDRDAQCHACHILKIGDNLDSILQNGQDEAFIFSLGSGVGTNVGSLRSSYEHIKGGGKASGPISFMRAYDANAGVIQSGGKTRRAAIMRTCPDSHPDVYHGPDSEAGHDFITIKKFNEEMAHVLSRNGYGGGMDNWAYRTVSMQNANLSVRISDDFMDAVKNNKEWSTRFVTGVNKGEPCNTFPAADMMEEISYGTWFCGDPGVQFDDTINRWHTCKNDGRINSSNPCSEYLFLDDTSCNLASLNLIKYWSPDNGFDTEMFMHDVRLMMFACDTSNSFAWFANSRLAQGVADYRTIGLGYGNLGALVMSHGYAYDSHKARLLMSAITSMLTSTAYLASCEMAKVISPFPRFEANKEPFIEVMKMHQKADADLEVLEGYEDVKKMSAFVWSQVVEDSERYGARNAQATVIAPTGTIMYMMDLSTSGPEPVLAHVSIKNLSGGGEMWLVNETFKQALKALDFSAEQRSDIEGYVKKYGTVEAVSLPSDVESISDYIEKLNPDSDYVCPPESKWETRTCPHLTPAQIPVFDTSFPAGVVGKRSINHMGHIKALAAIQPFISGGMSKTINMPESATVKDIKEAYNEAWRLGVKCVAIYRNGSKGIQPLTTTLKEEKSQPQELGKVIRRALPEEHEQCIRHEFRVGPVTGYMHISNDPETNMPVELFITASKLGDTLNGMLAGVGRIISRSLQCGVPLEEIVGSMKDIEFRPNGPTGKKFTPMAKSILDYVARYFEYRWLDGDKDIAVLDTARRQAEEEGHKVNRAVPYLSTENCPSCSTPMKMVTSKCHSCPNCGYSEGGCSG